MKNSEHKAEVRGLKMLGRTNSKILIATQILGRIKRLEERVERIEFLKTRTQDEGALAELDAELERRGDELKHLAHKWAAEQKRLKDGGLDLNALRAVAEAEQKADAERRAAPQDKRGAAAQGEQHAAG